MGPNIVYIHTHDSGRYVSPYGHAVPTPNIAQLAREGVLFRNAHTAAPTCSPSRAALLNGNWPHENGMLGLVHRGARLHTPGHHLAHVLREVGYDCGLIGLQHVAPQEDLGSLGYNEVEAPPSNHAQDVGPAAAKWLARRRSEKPFFLSVGFIETHRVYPDPDPREEPNYIAVPPGYPDTAENRLDTARLHTSLRSVDDAVGQVLAALAASGRAANTLVIFTTDHGLPWPGAKCNLGNAGTGVALVMRGPQGFAGGKVVDALISQLDIFPTVMELAGLGRPPWLRGLSVMPLVAGDVTEIRQEIFAEVTCHAAFEPMRAIRTHEWLYIKRLDGGRLRVLANVDDGPTKQLFVNHGWTSNPPRENALHNVMLDPQEQCNVIDDPRHVEIVKTLDARLNEWMRSTNDPLLDHTWRPPEHFRLEPRES
ncbi:sulfatase family protein [Martelella endophytica]|uniref:sulfatase family protein n=1 Tax=Martelella endophytica TaxID=1486262 RepID=UPI000ABB5773|nr:sulfatase [Martelella endophytica]